MATPVVKQATPLESPVPPETSFAAQVLDTQPLPEEACIQATVDEPVGIVAAQEITKKSEEVALEQMPGSLQVTAADMPVTEECVPSAEVPVSISMGTHAHETEAPNQDVQSQESVVPAEVPASQEVQHISAEIVSSGEEAGTLAQEICGDPNPPPAQELCADSVDGIGDAQESAVEGQINLCLDEGCKEHEVLPGDDHVDVATQNEHVEEKEAIIRLSKAIQSKGKFKCDDPLSTRHLSGGFSPKKLEPSNSTPPFFCINWVWHTVHKLKGDRKQKLSARVLYSVYMAFWLNVFRIVSRKSR